MNRFLFVYMVISVSIAQLDAQAEHPRARRAREAFEASVTKARAAYIQQLDEAIKEAGGAGDLDEANRLKEIKTSLELEAKGEGRDPISIRTKRLENTRWFTRKNPNGFIRFLRGNQTQNHLGTGGVWILTDKSTAITQSRNSGNIYLFRFDESLKSATVHRFEDAKQPVKYLKKF